MTEHKEPSFVHIGFKANKTGGWWYEHPHRRYTLQIVPANYLNPTRDERGWRIGIARPQTPKCKGIQWGQMIFSAPEAAALHAARVVQDDELRDRLWETMQQNDDEHKKRTQRAINNFMKRSAR